MRNQSIGVSIVFTLTLTIIIYDCWIRMGEIRNQYQGNPLISMVLIKRWC